MTSNFLSSCPFAQSDNQKETILNTVGHLDRYKTHDLCIKYSDGQDCLPYEGYDEPETKDCDCRWLTNTPEVMRMIVDEVYNYSRQFTDQLPLDNEQNYGDNIWLTSSKTYSGRYPFLVISTDGHISQGHNEIYGEDFTNFLRRFYLQNIYFPTLDESGELPICVAPSLALEN